MSSEGEWTCAYTDSEANPQSHCLSVLDTMGESQHLSQDLRKIIVAPGNPSVLSMGGKKGRKAFRENETITPKD